MLPLARDIGALLALLLPAWLFARLPRVRPTRLEVTSETLLVALILASLTAAVTAALGGTVSARSLFLGSAVYTTVAFAGHWFRAASDPRPRRLALRESLLAGSDDPASWPVWLAAAATALVHGLFLDIDVSARTPLVSAALALVGEAPAAVASGAAPPRGSVAMVAPALAAFGGLGLWVMAATIPAMGVLFGGRLARSLTSSAVPSAIGSAIVLCTPVVLMHAAPSPALNGAVFLIAGLALALDLDAPRVGLAPIPDASPLPVHASVGDVGAAAAFMAMALGAAIGTYPPAAPLALAIIGIVLLTRAPEAPGPTVLTALGTASGLVGLAPGVVLALALDRAPNPVVPALSPGLPWGSRPGLELIASVGTGLVALTLLGLWHVAGSRLRVPGCLLAGFFTTLLLSNGMTPFIGRDVEAAVLESAFLAIPLGVVGLTSGFVALETWRRAVAVGIVAAVLMVLPLLAARIGGPSAESAMEPARLGFERTRLTRGYPWPAFELPTAGALATRLGDVLRAATEDAVTARPVSAMTTAPIDIVVDLGPSFPFVPNVVALGSGTDGIVDATGAAAIRLNLPRRPERVWLVRVADNRLAVVMSASDQPGIAPGHSHRWTDIRLTGDRLGIRVRSEDTLELRLDAADVPGLEYVRLATIVGQQLDLKDVRRRGPP